MYVLMIFTVAPFVCGWKDELSQCASCRCSPSNFDNFGLRRSHPVPRYTMRCCTLHMHMVADCVFNLSSPSSEECGCAWWSMIVLVDNRCTMNKSIPLQLCRLNPLSVTILCCLPTTSENVRTATLTLRFAPSFENALFEPFFGRYVRMLLPHIADKSTADPVQLRLSLVARAAAPA